MKQYLELIKEVLEEGSKKEDRTGVGTISKFGSQKRYSLEDSFPLLTTKKVNWSAIVHELLWFISGSTNIKYLVDNDVRIWNEWPYEKFKKSNKYNGETLAEFAAKIKEDQVFAKEFGELGPVYGKQWRDFEGVDQLMEVVEQLKNNPSSRRIIISAWNVPRIKEMLLPPCHAFIQFYVNDGQLSCQLYQRSADVFLGVPFNIASYALLTLMLSQVTGLKAKEFIHTTGDTHIYSNHMDQVNEQLSRKTRKLPKVKLNKKITDITKFTFDDIELIDYDPHPPIRAKVAV